MLGGLGTVRALATDNWTDNNYRNFKYGEIIPFNVTKSYLASRSLVVSTFWSLYSFSAVVKPYSNSQSWLLTERERECTATISIRNGSPWIFWKTGQTNLISYVQSLIAALLIIYNSDLFCLSSTWLMMSRAMKRRSNMKLLFIF